MFHPVDVHVGDRVRFRRILLGFSQTELAEALGLSYQQIQKYEQGASRISASRLHQIASFLDVPISFFFDDMAPEVSGRDGPRLEAPVIDNETAVFVGAYLSVQDDRIRRSIRILVKQLAGGPGRA